MRRRAGFLNYPLDMLSPCGYNKNMATTRYEEIDCGGGRIKVRCMSCRADGFCGMTGWQGRIAHTKRCDFAARQTVQIPDGGAAALNGPAIDAATARFAGLEVDTANGGTSVPCGPSAADLVRAAKTGDLRSVVDTEDEVLAAVQRGQISISDAMNQDY